MGCSTAREAYSRNSKWMPRARFIDADYSVGIARRFCHREAHRHGNTSEISARIVCDVYIIAGTTGSRRSVTRWFASNGDDARMRTLGNNKASKENRFSLSLSLSLFLSHMRQSDSGTRAELQIMLIHYNLMCVRRARDVSRGSMYASVM